MLDNGSEGDIKFAVVFYVQNCYDGYSLQCRQQAVSVQAEERDFMKKKKHIISRVLPGSIAQELELEPGDVLAAINDTPVEEFLIIVI